MTSIMQATRKIYVHDFVHKRIIIYFELVAEVPYVILTHSKMSEEIKVGHVILKTSPLTNS